MPGSPQTLPHWVSRIGWTCLLLLVICIPPGIYFWSSRSVSVPSRSSTSDDLSHNEAQTRLPMASDSDAPTAGELENLLEERPQPLAEVERDTLWASPTHGAQLELEYVPDGTQCLIHLRPRELAASAEFNKTWKLLGNDCEQFVATWESMTSLTRDQVDRLLIAVGPSIEDAQSLVIVAWLVPGEAWDSHNVQFPEALAMSTRVISTSAANDGRRIAIFSARSWLPDNLGQPDHVPLVRKDLQSLLPFVDTDRMLTVVTTPQLPRTVTSQLPQEQENYFRRWHSAGWLEGVQSLLVSGHVGEGELFLEYVAVAEFEQQRGLRERLEMDLQQWVRSQATASTEWETEESWLAFARRWPSVADEVRQYTRFYQHQELVHANCSLPAVAIHNLVAGIALAALREEIRSKRMED